MSDFQQNTITNRQAVLDYIDANSGGGGGSQTLAQVLAQGQTTGNQGIFSDDLFTQLFVNDGGGALLYSNGSITYGVDVSGVTQLASSDSNTSELSRLQMQPTNTQFITVDTTGSLFSELILRSDYTTLTYFDNATPKISQLTLDNTQSLLVFNTQGVNNTVDVNANQAKLQFEDLANNIQATFLASQAQISAQFNDITADVQTGINADVNNTNIYYVDSTTPIENIIKVDADGYYLKDVPAHDDNAAAITAGLTAGYIFKTTGSGAITTSGVLCIVE